MGTNYYVDLDVCSKCGRPKEHLHIGKVAVGWRFLFHLIPKRAQTVEQWKSLISGAKITNEYGNAISEKAFWSMVESKQSLKRSPEDREVVHVGEHDFSEGEFE